MTGNLKTPGLDPELHEYLVSHSAPPDPLLEELTTVTRERFGAAAGMQIAPEQGLFMRMLTRLLGVKQAVEIGTFTGYSSINIARGLPSDGKLICIDVSDDYTSVARDFWERAGLEDQIELRLGDGLERVKQLPGEPHIDLAFVDADKERYVDYYEELVPRLNPGGVLLVDNVLWYAKVIDESDQHELTRAIRTFNDHVLKDQRTESVMLPIGDGLTLVTPAA